VACFLQTTTGDLDISAGNLTLVDDVPTETAQKLSNLFGLFKGEWFGDIRVGVPYFQYVFVQNPNLQLIGSVFEQVCQAAPGVAAVLNMELDFISRTRTLNSQITVQANDGTTIVGGVGTPFVIQIGT